MSIKIPFSKSDEETNIPEIDDALDMELGIETDVDASKVPDRLRLLLAFVGEGLGIVGAFILAISIQLEVEEGVVLGIGFIVAAVLCIIPIIGLELKKFQYAAELLALDSQTQMQDYDWWEQIDVEDYELVMLPQYSLDGDAILWDEEVLEDSISLLKQVVTRIGGKSLLNPTVLDRVVEARLKEVVADRQELNYIQRFFLWLFRIRPQIIPTDFRRLAEDWLSWAADSAGIQVNNRIGLFSVGFEEFKDIEGEIAVAQTERLQTYRSDKEEDLGIIEEETCTAKAWEVREIREHEYKEREKSRVRNRIKRRLDNSRIRRTFTWPYNRG